MSHITNKKSNPARTCMIIAVAAAVFVLYGIIMMTASGHGHYLSEKYKSGQFDSVLAVVGLPTSQSASAGGCTCPVCCKIQ